MVETVTLDELDWQVLQALQLDGRASFRLIGQVLGVSENTVARRYRNLCTLGLRTVARTVPARLRTSILGISTFSLRNALIDVRWNL